MNHELNPESSGSISHQQAFPFTITFVLITETSGVPIYYQDYSASKTLNDMTLLSGFVTAILSLSNLLIAPNTQDPHSANTVYYFDSGNQRFYMYQADNFNVCLSITSSDARYTIDSYSHNKIVDIVKKMAIIFNRIAKHTDTPGSAKEATDDHILSPEMITTLKKNITSLLAETTSAELTDHYFLKMEELIDFYNLAKENDMELIVQSLTELFKDFLQQ